MNHQITNPKAGIAPGENAPEPVYENVEGEVPEQVITATNMPRLDYAFPEAPASMNFFAVTAGGWHVQFTLRDIDEQNMMNRFAKFAQWLQANNVQPKAVGQAANKAQTSAPANTKLCPIHNVEMPERTAKKTGKKFYSHFVDDETGWCYGE